MTMQGLKKCGVLRGGCVQLCRVQTPGCWENAMLAANATATASDISPTAMSSLVLDTSANSVATSTNLGGEGGQAHRMLGPRD